MSAERRPHWDGPILAAVEDEGRELMQNRPGSPERIRGAILIALARTAAAADALADTVEREVTPSTGGAAERLRTALRDFDEAVRGRSSP